MAASETSAKGRRPHGDPVVVAIDGPAASGKSTLARRLAKELGWPHLDTGAMYRAVTIAALDRGVASDDATAVESIARAAELRLNPSSGRITIDGRDVTERIRAPAIDRAVSAVAEMRVVRDLMLEHQRRFARENGRIVADGRDMATRVFPDAVLKVFLDASEDERVRRRVEERRRKDPEVDPHEVRHGTVGRDRRDTGRTEDPLRPAAGSVRIEPAVARAIAQGERGAIPDAGAVILDTTGLAPDEVLAAVLALVRCRVPPPPTA